MSTPVGYDQQYCPIARGLDLLGDRWTLLIIRELSVGPRRFSELQRQLPGIAATVLSERLRSMAEDGLVEVVPTDPPSKRHRYALGPVGLRAVPVLGSLVRFGMPLLEAPADDTVVRPSLTIRAAITAYHDRAAAAGVDERYEIRSDGEVFTLDARGAAVEGTNEPDLVVTAPARVWIEIRQRRADFDQLVNDGVVTHRGSKKALAHFRSIYRFDEVSIAPQ
ncbi:MAG: helix-turn-helix transcriptional regulator [Actinobacteria bacterium]|nr:helix-turn-helix transcriptional regulator [Actinomycetota bacterium]